MGGLIKERRRREKEGVGGGGFFGGGGGGGGVGFSGGLLESNVESKIQKSGKFLGCLCHYRFLKKDFVLQGVIWLYSLSAIFLHISVLN